MRTQEEILERIESRKEDDMLGFEVYEYINALDFDHAKPYLVPGVTAEQWKVETKEDTLKRAKEYMPFAIGKAEDQRGISANRSIMHYIAWLWLLEEDSLLQKVEYEYETNYHSYGMPILEMIQEHFGWRA